MKNSLLLIFLSLFILSFGYSLKKISTATTVRPNTNKVDSTLVRDSIIETDTIITHQPFPWSLDNSCELGNYKVQGIIPAMRDSLTALSLTERLTNSFNPSKASSNYHGVDYTSNGINYSAAIDISVRCLTERQICILLDELSMRGFAGWYRKKGEDGWSGKNHIHAIWVAAPLKRQLAFQVKKWLAGQSRRQPLLWCDFVNYPPDPRSTLASHRLHCYCVVVQSTRRPHRTDDYRPS